MRWILVGAVVFVIVGCKRGEDREVRAAAPTAAAPTAAAPTAPVPSCADAINHAMPIAYENIQAGDANTADHVASCERDAWSPERLRCLAAVERAADFHVCNDDGTEEPYRYLNVLGGALEAETERVGRFPAGNRALTPGTPCCEHEGGQCPVDPDAWTSWQELGFRIPIRHRFQYAYEGSADGETMVVRAVGDPGCDGSIVSLELHGVHNGGIDWGVVIIDPTEPRGNEGMLGGRCLAGDRCDPERLRCVADRCVVR